MVEKWPELWRQTSQGGQMPPPPPLSQARPRLGGVRAQGNCVDGCGFQATVLERVQQTKSPCPGAPCRVSPPGLLLSWRPAFLPPGGTAASPSLCCHVQGRMEVHTMFCDNKRIQDRMIFLKTFFLAFKVDYQLLGMGPSRWGTRNPFLGCFDPLLRPFTALGPFFTFVEIKGNETKTRI